MTGYYDTKQMVEIFGVCKKTLENRISAGMIPKPIQNCRGGKRFWPKNQIDKIADGGGMAA